MRKIIAWGLAAVIGTAAALVVYSSLMIAEVEGSSMLPSLEPGAKVVANRLFDEEQLKVGDLIIYESPYYTVDGEGKYLIRRIVGIKGKWLKINSDAKMTQSGEGLIEKTKILGKVVLGG